MIRFLLYAFIGVINLLHPFIHVFEGGLLDIWLVHLDAVILQIDPYLPATKGHGSNH